MVPRPADLATVMLEHGTTADINVLHAVLGHANEDTIKRTALYYNIKLTGNFVKCHHCALAKAKQKSVSKQADKDRKATRICERLNFDISSVKATKFGGSKFWLLIVDEFSNMCWSFFLQRKSELPKRMMELIRNLRTFQQIDIEHVCCENVRCDDAKKTKLSKNFVKKMLSLLTSNILVLVPHNIMALLNANLRRYMVRCEQC
jgi:hypothetical protein